MTVRLEIRHPDGSIYWIENFSKRNDAEAWLAREMSQSYWNKLFISTFTEVAKKPVHTPIELAAKKAQVVKRNAARLFLRELKNPDKTTESILSLLSLEDEPEPTESLGG